MIFQEILYKVATVISRILSPVPSEITFLEMSLLPRKLPTPYSMEYLREHNPRAAKYFRPGTKGTRPKLVWERLWDTTNGEYGKREPTPGGRPFTKAGHRDDLWETRGWDTTYQLYGVTKYQDKNGLQNRKLKPILKAPLSPVKERIESGASEKVRSPIKGTPVLSRSNVLSLPDAPGSEEPCESRMSVLSGRPDCPTPGQSPGGPLPPLSRSSSLASGKLPPIGESPSPQPVMSWAKPEVLPVSKKHAMSGVGKAYLEHNLGKFWVSLQTPAVKN